MRILSSWQNARQTFIDKWNELFRFLNLLYTSQSRVFVLILAGLTFSLALVYFLDYVGSPFYHDSLYYWNLADQFDGKRFSFINYSDGLRGYFFPFLLFLLKKQAALFGINAQLLFQVYTALFFTVFSIYLLPWSLRTFFCWRTHLLGRAFIALLIFFFWRGYFRYPLSDIPAFALLLVGVTLLLSSLKLGAVPIWVVLAGLCIGAAVNTRPVYQISLIFIVPLVLIQLIKKGIEKGTAWLVLTLLGFSLVLLPQLQINSTHFGVKSPWVLARVVDDENLFVKQLFWGLGTQKFETNIGDNYPSVAVVYGDPFKLNFQKTNLLREKTIPRYVKIMKRFPFEIAVSYFRHLFNGLDIFFSTPYITNIYADHKLLSIFNYLIWFLVINRLLKLGFSQLEHINLLSVMGLLSPVILAIPTAVEVRFFLPLHMLAYGLVAFGLDYKAFPKYFLNNRWELLRFIIAFTLWLVVCFTLSTGTIENLGQ